MFWLCWPDVGCCTGVLRGNVGLRNQVNTKHDSGMSSLFLCSLEEVLCSILPLWVKVKVSSLLFIKRIWHFSQYVYGTYVDSGQLGMNGVGFFTPSGSTARFYNALPKFSLTVSFNRPYGYLCLQQGGWNNLDEGAREKLVCCIILYFVLFMDPTNYQIHHILSSGWQYCAAYSLWDQGNYEHHG